MMASSPWRRRLIVMAALALLLALPPISSVTDDPFLLDIGARILIYAIAAVSLDLVLGFGGMVSLGHAAFFGLGGYVTGILVFHAAEGTPLLYVPGLPAGSRSALLALAASMTLSALWATIVGAVSLRTSGVYFIMITLAFAQMLFYVFVSLPTYGGEDGLLLFGRSELAGLDLGDDVAFYYLCLAALVVFVWICHRLLGSRFGMVIRTARDNEQRMRALGYPVYRYKLVAFAISGAGTGLAGSLIANHAEFVSPEILHWAQSGEIMIMVILGGIGSLFGPVLGAAAFIMMEELLVGITEHWMVILGPLLIGAVLFARGGLFRLLAGGENVND